MVGWLLALWVVGRPPWFGKAATFCFSLSASCSIYFSVCFIFSACNLVHLYYLPMIFGLISNLNVLLPLSNSTHTFLELVQDFFLNLPLLLTRQCKFLKLLGCCLHSVSNFCLEQILFLMSFLAKFIVFGLFNCLFCHIFLGCNNILFWLPVLFIELTLSCPLALSKVVSDIIRLSFSSMKT